MSITDELGLHFVIIERRSRPSDIEGNEETVLQDIFGGTLGNAFERNNSNEISFIVKYIFVPMLRDLCEYSDRNDWLDSSIFFIPFIKTLCIDSGEFSNIIGFILLELSLNRRKFIYR